MSDSSLTPSGLASAARRPAYTQAPLDLEDVPRILAIEQAGHRFPWNEKIFVDCIHSGYYLDGAFANGTLIGFSVVMPIMDEWHLLNLCVDPRHARRGVGRFLMGFIMEQAQQAKTASLWLEVRSGNIPARNLYGQLGFDEVGLRKGYYPADSGREDARVMRLLLAPVD